MCKHRRTSSTMTRGRAAETARRASEEMKSSRHIAILMTFVLFCRTMSAVDGFLSVSTGRGTTSCSSSQHQRRCDFYSHRKGTTTQLLFNQWGGFGDFLNTNRTQTTSSVREVSSNVEGRDDDAMIAAGTTRLITVPVQSIKPGGLRVFLMFYCMGMQNTPSRMSWKADQPTTGSSSQSDEYVVDMHFHDHTGVLSVELKQDKIIMVRVGSLPSTQYLIQESLLVQGILDELEKCANDETIEVSNRLIRLVEDDAIENSRNTLDFR